MSIRLLTPWSRSTVELADGRNRKCTCGCHCCTPKWSLIFKLKRMGFSDMESMRLADGETGNEYK